MPDLASWLLDCIAEDEMTASRAGGELWMADEGAVRAADDGAVVVVEPTRHNQQFLDDAVHIARWDPARVLAECESKKRIVERHQNAIKAPLSPPCCGVCVDKVDRYDWEPESYPCPTLRLLALPYANRPGYREEWR